MDATEDDALPEGAADMDGNSGDGFVHGSAGTLHMRHAHYLAGTVATQTEPAQPAAAGEGNKAAAGKEGK